MPRNDDRRDALADAGLRLLAEEGSRGLTHRGVDRAAALPTGTCGNYFPTRDALVVGLCERAMQRLAPSPTTLADLESRPRDVATYVAYMQDLVRRALAQPETTLALFELRLLAHRTPEARTLLTEHLRLAFREDVRYAADSGLPGGAVEVALLHHGIEGLLLDRLTVPTTEGVDVDDAVRVLTERILGRSDGE